jgi:membrane-associated phospholipid phosphatase
MKSVALAFSVLLGCSFSAAHAADATNAPAAASALPVPPATTAQPAAMATSAVNSASGAPSYPALVWDDVGHVLTAPARWDNSDWKQAGWSAAAVIGTALVIDHPWRDFMRRQKPNNGFLAQVEKFGSQYSVGVVGGFLAVGALSGNENTLETGEDSLTASLIASGIITPTIKLAFGRARPRANKGVGYFKPFSDANASFPSGHTTEAFALASVISGHYEETWVSYTAYGLAGLVGVARTYHDAHFASDVLAGAMIGTVVGNSVVVYNRERRGGNKVALLPQLAPGVMGVQLVGNF